MVRLPVFSEKRQKGQALILILLVMSLVLTVVLSSVSKSVTDVEISKYEDNSIRAFDAAQAGIEKAVVGQATSGEVVDLGNEASFTPVLTSNTNTGIRYKYPIGLMSGESAVISFVDHKISNGDYVIDCDGTGSCQIPGQIRVCWGLPGTSPNSATTPALYLEFYYNSDLSNPQKWENNMDLADIKIASASADTNANRRITNNFLAPISGSSGLQCSPGSSTYAFNSIFTIGGGMTTIPPLPNSMNNGSLLFLKITVLYNTDIPHPVGIASAQPLPSQGSIITSTGQAGDVYRKLVLFQGYPEIPFEIGNAIYSKGALTK
jgi:hypothetical protein